MYQIAEGERLVKAARNAISLSLDNVPNAAGKSEAQISDFTDRSGVFVTINSYPKGDLRGCIGFPQASGRLCRLLVNAAIYAATEDPRFPPLDRSELDTVTVDVNILSALELLHGSDEELVESVVVGKHGLVIASADSRGLLLPSVAKEQGWDAREFLQGVCEKAGLRSDAWADGGARLYRFSTQEFRELEPNGRVIEVKP